MSTLNLPLPNPKTDRWLLIGCLAILVLLGVWVSWRPEPTAVYSDNTPVLVGKRGERRLQQAFDTHQQAADQAKQKADSAAAAAAPLLQSAKKLRHATHSLRPRALPTRPAAVVRLADSLQRVLANY